MKHAFLALLLISLTVFFRQGAGAEEPVLIVEFLKEGRVEKDGSGPFAALVDAILDETSVPTVRQTMPIKRTLREFAQGNDVCIVPVSFSGVKALYDWLERDRVLESEPIDVVSAHIVTRPGGPVIADPAELNGRTVMAWTGTPAAAFLAGTDVKIINVESEAGAVNLLMSKRVDAIISWVPDSFILFEKLGYGPPSVDLTRPLFVSETHFLCRKTPSTTRLMAQVNAAIRTMREDGRIKSILSSHARVVGVDVPLMSKQQASNPPNTP